MTKFELIKNHLSDNTGDENISKMIWIVVVFVVGAILLALITGIFRGQVTDWFNGIFDSWFGDSGGAYNGAYNETP